MGTAFRETFYFAQSFETRGALLAASPPRRFDTAEEAIWSARRAAERKPGAIAYAVEGGPCGREAPGALLLFRSGRIPREAEELLRVPSDRAQAAGTGRAGNRRAGLPRAGQRTPDAHPRQSLRPFQA